ncbi:hypothetical protein FA95DRAFT_1455891, partial [Auriscalpium vulgare]
KRIRPGEVHNWMKAGRKLARPPDITNVPKYGTQWRSWWVSMQPQWRRTGADPWPLVREQHPEEEWLGIRKGGKNGFALLLLTIIWW